MTSRKTPLPPPRHRRQSAEPVANTAEPVVSAPKPSPATVLWQRARRWLLERPFAAVAAGGFALIVLIALVAGGDAGADDAQPNTAAKVVADAEAAELAAAAWAADVQRLWVERELSPGGFARVDGAGLGGGACVAGAVSAIDVTLCDYTDASAADAAKSGGLASIGDNTGAAVVANGRMLVVADRKRADPSGRSVQAIIDGFRAASQPR